MNHLFFLYIIDYKDLLDSRAKIIGVWDDHDYGSNNADYTMKSKFVMRELYLDFLGEPMDTPRRLNRDIGLY
jgi:alkaline phosphatase D